MLIGLALTATRGPWIALAIGMSALYLPKRYVMAFTLTGAVALACFIYRPEAGQKEVQRQLQTELAFKGIKKRPIQGIGGDQFAFLYLSMPTKFATKWRDTFTVHFQDHSHNSFIEVLSAQGIIGSVYALMLLVMILSALEGWKLGAFMSLLTYSLLNPLALPAKVLMVALASASIHGRGIQKVYVLSIVLMAAPLWHWFYEARLRSGTDGQKVNAALNLRIVERR